MHVKHAEKHEEHAGTEKPAWQAEVASRATTQHSAGTSLLVAEESEGSSLLAVLASAVGMSQVEPYQSLKTRSLVATLPDAWRCSVSAGLTGLVSEARGLVREQVWSANATSAW